jgi:predicted phage terminase large subunit-like protein
LADNPSLDREAYEASLANLDSVTRAQLLNGDWTARQEGSMFRREWFDIVDEAPVHAPRVRYWDEAATDDGGDWTCGARCCWADGVLYIEDMRRAQLSPAQVDKLIRQTAETDGQIPIRSEQEPGSSGKARIDHLRRIILPGWNYDGDRKTGDKATAARSWSGQAEAGNVKIVRGPWNAAFLDEAETFPLPGFHDDQIDAVSGAFAFLVNKYRRIPGVIDKPKGV